MASDPDRLPVLLCDATWYGTLAAARNLGAHGVPVTLASDTLLAPARWSRHVTRTVPAPSPKHAGPFVEWLLRFGAAEPPHVFYPTSDEIAWLLAAHAEELSPFFRLYSPPLETLVRLLDKKLLLEAARGAGLDVPETRIARDESEVEACGRELGFPLYVKPRAQVLGVGAGKGVRVEEPGKLVSAWRNVRAVEFDREVRDRLPDLALPLIQACSKNFERVYTVDGFIDETGELYVSMACLKVLQRPRGSGPGIIFEHAELDRALDQALQRLFRATGFYGVFDAEFVEAPQGRVLIDVNPRFYNHMAFEIDRGMHLPWLAYLAAIGDERELRREIRVGPALRSENRLYVHRLGTSLLFAVQSLSGRLSRDERQGWQRLIAQHAGAITDPAATRDDLAPGLIDLAFETKSLLRHPRAYLRALLRRG